MSISSACAVTFREIIVELGIQFQDETKLPEKFNLTLSAWYRNGPQNARV